MSARGIATQGREEDEGGWLGLVTFVAFCIAVGVGLWWFTGPPTMLTAAPDWSYIREVLSGSEVRDRDVITVTAGVAWIIVGYVLLAVVLRLLFGVAVALTGGAGWARAALQATSPFTIPVVRRMVDATIAGTIIVSATLHAPSATVAASASTSAAVETRLPVHTASFDATKAAPSEPAPAHATETVPKVHVVVRGDNLWRIAERYLDDGFRWTEIWQLNRHQPMDDGRLFVDPNLIYPGWLLQLPDDADVGTSDDSGLGANPTPPDPEVIPEGDASPTPSTPDATPTPATPTPTAAAGGPAVSPIAPPTGDDDAGPALRPSLPEISMPGDGAATAASVAGAAASSVAMLLVFRRFLRHRRASAVAGERRPLGSGDAGRVVAIASALRSGLADLDFADSRVLLVRESEHYLEFTLDCPPGDAEALAGSGDQLSRRLGCVIDAEIASSTTVRLKASRISRLASSLLPETGPFPDLLLPVGASESGIFYLNLAAVGSVLVAGGRLATRELVSGWLTTLTSAETGAPLAFSMDASARDHLDFAATSLADGDLGTADGLALTEWSRQLEHELIGRQHEQPPAPVIAVAGPVAEAEDLSEELDGVMRLGPERGLHLVAIADGHEVSRVSRSFGASVVLGEEADLEGSRVAMLEVAGRLALELEQVVVRRQVASRPAPVEQDADSFADFEPFPQDSDWQVSGHDATSKRDVAAGGTTSRPEPHPDTDDWFRNADDDDAGGVAPATADELDWVEDAEADGGSEPGLEVEPHAPAPSDEVTSTDERVPPGTNVEPSADPTDGPTEPARDAGDNLTPSRASTAPLEQERGAAVLEGDSATVEPPTPSTNGVHEETIEEPAPESRDTSPTGTLDRQSALPIDDIEVDGSTSGPPLRARLFGAFELETRDGPIHDWSIQKSRELAAYLLAHGGAPVLRETVAGSLWPRMPITAAKHQGANAAYYLRRTLSRVLGEGGGQVITGANQRYGVRPGTIRTDVDAFDAHLHRAERLEGYEALIEYERGLTLYRDDFLAPEMFEWADTYQRSYRSRYLAAAHRAARLAVDCRDTELAVRYYESILRFDPVDEDAVRGLLRCFALLGDTNSARLAYKRLVTALRETLDDDHAEPMPATTKVLNDFHTNGHRTGEASLDDR